MLWLQEQVWDWREHENRWKVWHTLHLSEIYRHKNSYRVCVSESEWLSPMDDKLRILEYWVHEYLVYPEYFFAASILSTAYVSYIFYIFWIFSTFSLLTVSWIFSAQVPYEYRLSQLSKVWFMSFWLFHGVKAIWLSGVCILWILDMILSPNVMVIVPTLSQQEWMQLPDGPAVTRRLQHTIGAGLCSRLDGICVFNSMILSVYHGFIRTWPHCKYKNVHQIFFVQFFCFFFFISLIFFPR